MINEIKIEDKIISNSNSVYIIGEMSANHLMDYDRAKKIIKGVAESGADAIKLQTYTADTITIDCSNEHFQAQKGGLWEGETLYSLYQKAYTPWEWQGDLQEYANSLGLACFSSPFDFTAVDFMESINMPAYKIAAPEIRDIPLIRKTALTGKPIMISTGIAHLEDIERAVETCKEAGNNKIILLKCTSEYPCPYEDVNLNNIPNMANAFDCIVGISDHTFGSEVALGAVALGAKVIEKHVTIKRSDGGPDGGFSMEMHEFKDMIKQVRNLEKALGNSIYSLTDKQEKTRLKSRSLYVVKDVKEGEIITVDNIKSIRPGYGLHTMYYEEILGKKFRKSVDKGTPITWDIID